MARMRGRYEREFKISVVSELESGKPLAQIARECGTHPSLPCRWRSELAENPERAFAGNGNLCTHEARNSELERLLCQTYAENEVVRWKRTDTPRNRGYTFDWIHLV
jgi:transposase